MNPDYAESLRFLRMIYPEGPWMLTAISVDKKMIEARTFFPDEEEQVAAWLKLNGNRNLYYSVNEPTASGRTCTKLQKTDVHRAHYVHVDVDPRVGEDVSSEQARILQLIRDYPMRPTVVVFSGGGYNVLWKLEQPFDVAAGASSKEEIISRAEDFERRNWQKEHEFSTPDHCRDVSRILRLPGTVNRPDAKKIAKGRTPALAFVVESTDVAYPLSAFPATPHVARDSAVSGDGERRVIGDVRRLASLEELPQEVPEHVKVVIAQGFDPDKPHRWPDRSSALFWVCCELVRAGVEDEVILGIITDQRFAISESVLDKGSATNRYAARQVHRARDFAIDPLLERMNREFAVIKSYGGKTMVMVEQGAFDPNTEAPVPVFQTFRDFKNRIANYPKILIQVGKKTKEISAYDWWTTHPRRREFHDVTFQPGIDTPGRYNLFSGFPVQPKPGPGHRRLLEHVRENICSGNEQHASYMINWMARIVQFPRTCTMVAPVLIGARGTGKSILTNFLRSLFMPHAWVTSDPEKLTGRFNASLAQSLLMVAEEAYDPRDKKHTAIIKDLITGQSIDIEKKGVDRVLMPNYVHLIITANPDSRRVVPAGDHERRFFVLHVSDKRRQDSDYFRPILEDARGDGPANLLYYLLNEVDLSGFEVTDFPRTDALREQQEHSLGYEYEWLLGKLEAGRWTDEHRVGDPWRGPIRKALIHQDYLAFMKIVGARRPRGERSFHKFIMQSVPGTTDRQIFVSPTDRPMVFEFPSLEECRRTFDEARGWRTEWRPPAQQDADADRRAANVVSLRHPME